MTTTPDPFAEAERKPALSFNNKPIGTRYVGRVTALPHLVQARDFDTNEPATWGNGDPKMAVVTRIDINGDEFDIWAVKPSAMFRAIAEAQQRAGQRIALDGTLEVTFTGETPSDNPRKNPQKQYSVTYRPPDAFASSTAGSSSMQDDEPPF